ncbi:MAG: c-type cytochrome [Candidatus Binatia bacterium]
MRTLLVPALLVLCLLVTSPGNGDAASLASYVPQREAQWNLLRYWLGGGEVVREPVGPSPKVDREFLELGERLFGMYCVNCHGASGRGDGPRSAALHPPPRDFTAGLFKFRSTPSGEPPTPRDLFRTVTGGLRGTAMVPFGDIAESERWALVAWVRHLASVEAAGDGSERSLAVSVPDALDDAGRLARGGAVYAKLECARCHGERGRGDGPSAAELEDALGRPLPPPDFATQPLKRGDDPRDLFLSIVTGLDGSAMPAYADTAEEGELWDLVAFVRSLRLRGSKEATPADVALAEAALDYQHAQGSHAVVKQCGCQARRQAEASTRALPAKSAETPAAPEDSGCGEGGSCGGTQTPTE